MTESSTPVFSAPVSASNAASNAALEQLSARLPLIRKPAQYAGLEHNATRKTMQEKGLNCCLIFPDLYEIGMSHQGLQIIYHVLNSITEVTAHRAYAPDVDMEALLREEQVPLFALESGESLADYDMLGFTLPYELCYINILTVLDLAGLPHFASERDERHPFILGGGSCACNPEPVADFFDAILLGDGETAVTRIAAILLDAKRNRASRPETLKKLALEVPGLYVPRFFQPEYDRDGHFLGAKPLLSGYAKVQRTILPELDQAANLRRPLVAAVTPVHDRLAMEIARGCTRGCRFCQAGMIYRPVRERRLADIMSWAEDGIRASGFEEMALLSLSTGDYSCLNDLVLGLMNRFTPEKVSLSMPSMRVGTITPEIMDQIRRVRKTGFTVAPEAGSERLRQAINKGITEEDLLATCKNAFSLGWKLIKFYFMIGLPTETGADVEAIATLVKKARQEAGDRFRSVQINAGVGTFVPKPHTPFQWEAQLGIEAAQARLELLKHLLPFKGYKLKWHEPEQSFLEGVFSRGDRRLSALIERAWRMGARLDGWGEHFDVHRWQVAASDCGLDLDSYLAARPLDAALPWDHLDCGVSREFLLKERERAHSSVYTPDCRNHGCQGCGVCDFRSIRPVASEKAAHPAHPVQAAAPQVPQVPPFKHREPTGNEPRFIYRVHYTRLDGARFLGHLELLQLVFRVIRRAGLPIAYTQGFNPSPKVSFSQALAVGMESLVEYFDMELSRPVSPNLALVERLNRELPPGLTVQQVEFAPKKNPQAQQCGYAITVPAGTEPQTKWPELATIPERIADFLAKTSVPLERTRKGKTTTVELRPLVRGLFWENGTEKGTIQLSLEQHQGKPGASPRDILEHALGLPRDCVLSCRIVKTASEPIGQSR